MKNKAIIILLIEDNPGDARLIQEMLVEAGDGQFVLEIADQLSLGMERLAEGVVDAVLLDLGLPDSQGLDTFITVHSQAPEVPIVVLTGLEDESLATQAMREGAQDYLTKGQLDKDLLIRAIRYAIERQRLLRELERAKQREQQERELRSLEQLSAASPTAVTAQTFGIVPLQKGYPSIFNKSVKSYGDLLKKALEQRMYKIDHNISHGLQSMAEQLGFLRAGPRDVIELHLAALKKNTKHVTPEKAKVYAEEGRVMALELMGFLVSFYRDHSLGFQNELPFQVK